MDNKKKIDRDKLKVCQFGAKCYRKNPIHFSEYAHPHLDKIYDKGRNSSTNEYLIPNELSSIRETLEIQLRLLEKLFPKSSAQVQVEKSSEENTKTTVQSVKESDKPPTSNGEKLAKASKLGKRSVSPTPSTSTGAGSSSSNLAKKLKMNRDIKDYVPVVLEKGRMAEKLKNAAPYNMFLTAITDSKPTHSEPLTVTMQEIFDDSLGEIESSVQINFMVEIGWLLGHYYFAGISDKPLLILYGADTPELQTISTRYPNVSTVHVRMPTPFATSHTKMMLIGYTDGSMRVIISTANLYEDDWHNRTQGVWISPRLPALPEDADTGAGESLTNFKQDLMLYLVEYKIPQLQPWLGRIRKSDFSAVNVVFIGSVPGGFREGPVRGHPWGHTRLGSILQKHSAPIDEKVPVVCQSSSIGSLGANVQAWVQHDFLNSARKDGKSLGIRQLPPFKMIYPSFGNVSNSHDGLLGGGCLPYGKNTNDKQPWLKGYLQQWKSHARHRSRAMPHIKSYTRFNLQEQCVYWFLLTSANLSKAAWGALSKSANIQASLRIYNYEAGVLFLPKFVTGEDTFPLGHKRGEVPAFPLPYDVPLTPYGPDDRPFLMDYLNGD